MKNKYVMAFERFVNENNNASSEFEPIKFKEYTIEIKESGDYINADVKMGQKTIGMVSVSLDGNTKPYVADSHIDTEHQRKGLGRFVYDLLDDCVFKKNGKHITHGAIQASISAIRLWRKRLNDPNYLPNGFEEYWDDDIDWALKELNK